jgi:hypothetical protein
MCFEPTSRSDRRPLRLVKADRRAQMKRAARSRKGCAWRDPCKQNSGADEYSPPSSLPAYTLRWLWNARPLGAVAGTAVVSSGRPAKTFRRPEQQTQTPQATGKRDASKKIHEFNRTRWYLCAWQFSFVSLCWFTQEIHAKGPFSGCWLFVSYSPAAERQAEEASKPSRVHANEVRHAMFELNRREGTDCVCAVVFCVPGASAHLLPVLPFPHDVRFSVQQQQQQQQQPFVNAITE